MKWYFVKINTVRCRYNAVNFITNIHKRHPMARPLGRGMGCLLWIQHLIDIISQFLQLSMQNLTILDRVITALDCNGLIITGYIYWGFRLQTDPLFVSFVFPLMMQSVNQPPITNKVNMWGQIVLETDPVDYFRNYRTRVRYTDDFFIAVQIGNRIEWSLYKVVFKTNLRQVFM